MVSELEAPIPVMIESNGNAADSNSGSRENAVLVAVTAETKPSFSISRRFKGFMLREDILYP